MGYLTHADTGLYILQPADIFESTLLLSGKQLALLNTNSAVRTCGFDFSGNIIMFSTDKQMGYQCFLNFFDLRDPQQIGTRLMFFQEDFGLKVRC